MEVVGGLGIYLFGATGRVYGLLFGVRGRAYVVGATRRGIFYRFGAKIYSPKSGRFESIFSLRTSIGGVELNFKNWLRDETITLRFRRDWIRGTVNVSRHGLYTFQLFATEPEAINQYASRNYDEVVFSAETGYSFTDTEEWKQLDSD